MLEVKFKHEDVNISNQYNSIFVVSEDVNIRTFINIPTSKQLNNNLNSNQ